MKGLLLKDWYMIQKYCRSYILITAVIIGISLANGENLFFTFYPCMLCGMIPVTLLGYDERSGWMQYSGTMPYAKEQIVSEKYLIGILVQLTMLLVTGIAQATKMMIAGDFVLGKLAVLMLLMLVVSMLASSIPLPFIFKLGVEKGRTAYYVVIGCMRCKCFGNQFLQESAWDRNQTQLGVGNTCCRWSRSICTFLAYGYHFL